MLFIERNICPVCIRYTSLSRRREAGTSSWNSSMRNSHFDCLRCINIARLAVIVSHQSLSNAFKNLLNIYKIISNRVFRLRRHTEETLIFQTRQYWISEQIRYIIHAARCRTEFLRRAPPHIVNIFVNNLYMTTKFEVPVV